MANDIEFVPVDQKQAKSGTMEFVPYDEDYTFDDIVFDPASGGLQMREKESFGMFMAKRMKEADLRAEEREDLWASIPGQYQKIEDERKARGFLGQLGHVASGGHLKDTTSLALPAIGGLGQRVEALGANVLEEIQTPGQVEGNALLDALTGKRLGEYGDFFYRAGVPSGMSAVAGLGMSMVTDPVTVFKLGKAFLKGGYKGLLKVLPQIGTSPTAQGVIGKTIKEGVGAGAGTVSKKVAKESFEQYGKHILGVDDDLMAYAAKTKFGFEQPVYTKSIEINGKTLKPTERITNFIGKQVDGFGEYASKLYDDIKVSGAASGTQFTKHAELLDATREFIGLGSELAGQNASPSTVAFAKKLLAKLEAPNKMASKLNTVSDILAEAAQLKSVAKFDPIANQAFGATMDIVGESFEPLAKARESWKNYSSMQKLFEKMVGSPLRTVGDEVVYPAAGRLKQYWTKQGATDEGIQIATRELDRMFKHVGLDVPVETYVQNVSAAHQFAKVPPSLKPLIIGAYLRAILNLPSNLITGAAQGGMLGLSSPKMYSKTGKMLYNLGDKSSNLSKFGNTVKPMVDALSGMADIGIQRQLTGRNNTE